MRNLKVGFVGLGQQGRPMAEQMLAGGYPLWIWARRADVVGALSEIGAGVAASLGELGGTVDHVGVCVVDDAGVAEVCGELIPEMRPGSLLAMHSTILPETCESLDRQCAGRGVLFVDAPVSGGGAAASEGSLTVMCGGTLEAFERALPVFQTFSHTVIHLGEAGSGQRAKIVNNSLMAANMGLALAAVEAGRELGLDTAALKQLILKSSGKSFAFEVYARLPSPQSFSHGAPLLNKDMELLRSILPDSYQADLLHGVARNFLSIAEDVKVIAQGVLTGDCKS